MEGDVGRLFSGPERIVSNEANGEGIVGSETNYCSKSVETAEVMALLVLPPFLHCPLFNF
jgi:hypothetical protein